MMNISELLFTGFVVIVLMVSGFYAIGVVIAFIVGLIFDGMERKEI